MANTKDFFLTVIQRVFSNWTALMLAVEHSMGPKERAIEFCPYIMDMMYMNEKLENDEIASELEDYLDAHFNTELEDNSAIQVANELLRFHQYCMQGNEELAMVELSKLPPLQAWIMAWKSGGEKNIRPRQDNDQSNSENDEPEDKEMNTTDNDWVEVKTRRRT